MCQANHIMNVNENISIRQLIFHAAIAPWRSKKVLAKLEERYIGVFRTLN